MSKYYSDRGELYHYGILGMRWGRRKQSDDPSSETPRSKDLEEIKSTVKNATKRGSLIAASILTASLGRTAAKSLSDTGHDKIAKAVKVGSSFVALHMATATAIGTVRDFRSDQQTNTRSEKVVKN